MIRITRQMSDSKQLKLETLLSSIRKLEQFRPAIITDIDGVLFRGAVPIPRTIEALRKIKLRNIPFACLTNGGGQMEETKAQKMNKIIGEDYFTGE